MEIQFKIIGILLILLALVHFSFPKLFNWKQELNSVSLINRQLMYVHTFFIGLVVFLMGVLCFTSSYELTSTVFGKKISFGLSIFWGIRLFVQFFGYSSKIWKGKLFETSIHFLFALLWIYLTVVFLVTYIT